MNAVNTIKPTDYALEKNWSVKDEAKNDIDVFFVHPTTYGPPSNGKYVADLNDEKLNKITDRDTVNWLTAIFSENCNVFAPRYRQVNIEVMKMDDKRKDKYMEFGIKDITEAFKYYLNYINDGRPFILASHSQGSNVLLTILKKHPEMLDKSKLVVAYMPGWTFTDKDIAKLGLPLSEKPDQTGCLITWNTIGPGGTSPTIKKGARCVNPLSWTTDPAQVPANKNIGAKIYINEHEQLQVNNFTAARINKDGALEIPSPPENIAVFFNMSLGPEVYHRYDYDFFYCNVKENVKERCAAYLNKK